MKFTVLVICAALGVVLGESAEDQQIEQPIKNQLAAQDRVFDLSRKSRQLFDPSCTSSTGTGYPYSGGIAYPYQVGAGVTGYTGYSGVPTTGLGFNSGQYSTALYGGGPYGGSSFGSGVYGGGLYGGSQYGGLYGGGLYGGSGLGLTGGYGGYNQFAADPYSSLGPRGIIPTIPYRRGY